MIQIYTIISIVVALYVLFFMPSMLIYFVALSPFDYRLAKLDNQLLNAFFQNIMPLIPAIPVTLVMIYKKLYSYSVYTIQEFRNPIILISVGHLGLFGIIYIFYTYSQLAGWLSIPVYIFCSTFYGIGSLKLIIEREKKLNQKFERTR